MPPRAGPASHLHFSSLLLTESRTAAHSLLRKSCMCFPHSACWVCSHQPVPMTSTSPMLPLFPHFQITPSIAYFTRENALGFGSIFRSNSVLRSRPGTYNQSQTPAVIKTEATASVPSQDTKLKLVQDLRSQTTLYCPVVNKYTCKVYGQHLINIGIQLLCITRYKITGTGKKIQNIQVTTRRMTGLTAGKPPEGKKFSDYQLTFLTKNTPRRIVFISCSASGFQTIPQNAPLSTSKTNLQALLYGQLTLLQIPKPNQVISTQ